MLKPGRTACRWRVKPGNLLFYEDPDYGFVLNALIKAPGLKTSVHDHGRSWTLYGVLEGGETVMRLDRIDDGLQVPEMADIREAGSHEVVPGYIDFRAPWEIHQEHNSNQRTVVSSSAVGAPARSFRTDSILIPERSINTTARFRCLRARR